MKKYPCPVCGTMSFYYDGGNEICDVCNWEDDLVQRANPDEEDCANAESLNQARANWLKSVGEKKII